MIYGKFFAHAFTGSLIGAGPHIFSVLSYVISHMSYGNTVELNPTLLAHLIGMPVEDAQRAIDYLSAEDPKSRSAVEGGRRIVHEGGFLYRVVNGGSYRAIRDDEDRREYMRIKKAESRARLKGLSEVEVAEQRNVRTLHRRLKDKRSKAEE